MELYLRLNNDNTIYLVSTVKAENSYLFKSNIDINDLSRNSSKYKMSDDYTIVDGEIIGTLELIPAILSLSQDAADMKVGDTLEIIANVSSVDDKTIVFKSLNPLVAKAVYDKDFDSYEIIGISKGTATIRFVSKENRSVFKDLTINVE